MRKPIIFSFQQKSEALTMIKEKGLVTTVHYFSQLMAYPLHPMRLALEKLNRTAALLDEGILEKSDSNLITFTHKNCSQQPSPVNSKYLSSLSASLVSRIEESIPYLNKKYVPRVEYEV